MDIPRTQGTAGTKHRRRKKTINTTHKFDTISISTQSKMLKKKNKETNNDLHNTKHYTES